MSSHETYQETGQAEADRQRLDAWRRLAPMSAWSITELDILHHRLPRRLSLDQVVADELDEFEPGKDGDRVVWQGSIVRAVIRTNAEGKAEVVHFDGGRKGEDR